MNLLMHGSVPRNLVRVFPLATRRDRRTRAQRQLQEAAALIEERSFVEAFAILNQLKAGPGTLRDVDYLRARCFAHDGQPQAAVEALKEELRLFPDHRAAAAQLAELEAAQPPAPAIAGDPEFQELHVAVRSYTMVGPLRLRSLFQLAREVCAEDLPGQFVECGVAAGGSAALLAAVAHRHSRRPRRLFAFDTFAGMPPPTREDTHLGVAADATGWGAGTCAAPEHCLREISRRLGVETLVEPVRGLFARTLPANRDRIGAIALLHLDGDWYASTRDILENLYDRVVPGGRIQIDDYGHWEGCRRAVTEFAQSRRLHLQLHPIDETGVWFSK